MINQRLFDWYGIDTSKNLKMSKKCPRPYDTLLIDKLGNCYACECTSWLPQSVGNLQLESIQDIVKGLKIKILQNSIADGSFRYCNEHQCPYMHTQPKIFNKDADKTTLKYIRLAIDDSCNLRCPSCRKDKIFLQKGKVFQRRKTFADKVLNYLEEVTDKVNVTVGSDGDPFASLIYRYFIRNFPKKENLTLSLQTNGLLVKKYLERNPDIVPRLTALNISIDGATKSTYEKLRLGGKWEDINRNLSYLSALERDFKINLHMVVQKDNYLEMEALYELCRFYNFDEVFYTPIRDWNTGIDFSEQDFFKSVDFTRELEKIKKYQKKHNWILLQNN